jgi:hypothetical protein
MKQVVQLIGCIALIALTGLALSCKQEEEDRPSTLSAPDISSTPDFPRDVDVEFVSSYYEALTLFNSIKYPLSYQLGGAFEDAITAAYSKDKITGPGERRSITLRLPNGYAIPAIPGATIDNGISSGTYSNSSIGKRSGSATFNITRFTAAGDRKYVQEEDEDGNITFVGIIDDTIPAAGVVKVSGRSDYEIRHDMVNDVDLGFKQSDEDKYAFALTVYNTTSRKCAKFRFAYTKSASDNEKSGRNFLETTTVEVYNRSDMKIYELNDVRSSGFDSLDVDNAAFNAAAYDW